MSRNPTNNPGDGACDESGVFDPLDELHSGAPAFGPQISFDGTVDSRPLDPRDPDPSFRRPAAGEAELRRAIRSRLNAYFDAEGQRDRVAAREALHDLSRIPGANDELAAMRRVLSAFDTPPQHPDLTRVVLAKVAKRGTLMSKPARRRISAARVLIAASLLVVVGTFVYIDRSSTAPIQGPAGTISAVVEAQRSDAADSVRNLARAVDTLRSDLMEPVGALVADSSVSKREPQRALAMGDTSAYEESSLQIASGPDALPGAAPSAHSPSTYASSFPLTRVLPIARSEFGDARTGPNLAGVGASETPAFARAIASAPDAWAIAPTPSIILPTRATPSIDPTAQVSNDLSPRHLNLSGVAASPSIDDAITRGGLLTNVNTDPESLLGTQPEIRLRPDGSRTVLWWIFPDASNAPGG